MAFVTSLPLRHDSKPYSRLLRVSSRPVPIPSRLSRLPQHCMSFDTTDADADKLNDQNPVLIDAADFSNDPPRPSSSISKDSVVNDAPSHNASPDTQSQQPTKPQNTISIQQPTEPLKSAETDPIKSQPQTSPSAQESNPIESNDSKSDVVDVAKLKLSPEQIESARAARNAAQIADDKKAELQKEKRQLLLNRAQLFFTAVGTRTRTFELGTVARARVEEALSNTEKAAQAEEATKNDKLKASAVTAARSVGTTVADTWTNAAVPWLKKKVFPDIFESVSSPTIATITLAAFLTLLAVPSLFSSGPSAKQTLNKQLDADTAALERKLQRQKNLSAQNDFRSKTNSELFPTPQDSLAPPKAKTSQRTKTLSSANTEALPAPALPEVSQTIAPEQRADVSRSSASTLPTQPNAEPSGNASTPSTNPTVILRSVTKALGPRSSLILSSSIDMLTAEPTILLQVAKSYHRLPAIEQTQIAGTALAAAQSLGYQNISLVEQGTGIEVAHGGVGVTLEDESQNLRAEVAGLQKLSERLAVQTAHNEAEGNILQDRILQEREEFAAQKGEFEKSISSLKAENSNLSEDLLAASTEISGMPDRLELERRTEEAEGKAGKLEDTVEMLSIQVSKARDAESQAKQEEKNAIKSAEMANTSRDEALASVSQQLAAARKEAESRADESIAKMRSEALLVQQELSKKVEAFEQMVDSSQKEATKKLEESTKLYEKMVSEEKGNREKEVEATEGKYERMLDDLGRKAKAKLDAYEKEADKKMAAILKEATSNVNSVTKERDSVLKEKEKLEIKIEKETNKAGKEKEMLRNRITKLEAKLKSKDVQDDGVREVNSDAGEVGDSK